MHPRDNGMSDVQAKEIWDLKGQMIKKDIAEKFGVNISTVQRIHRKECHKYLHNDESD